MPLYSTCVPYVNTVGIIQLNSVFFLFFRLVKSGKMPLTKKTPRKTPDLSEPVERLLCPFCPKTFKVKEQRDRHIIECTDTRLFCEFCNYNTSKRSYLNKHLKKMHCTAEQAKSSENSDNETDVVEESDRVEETTTECMKGSNKLDNLARAKSAEKGTEIKGAQSKDLEVEEGELSSEQKHSASISKDIFEDISSSEESDGKEASGIKDIRKVLPKERDTRSSSPKVLAPSQQQLEEGRTFRRKTQPSIVTPAKRHNFSKTLDLRQKLNVTTKSNTPTIIPVPRPSTITAGANNAKPRIAQGPGPSNRRYGAAQGPLDDGYPPMKTKYVKVVTKYWENGKKIKIVEMKEPI